MPIQEINAPTQVDLESGWRGAGWYYWDSATHLVGPFTSKQFCEENETRFVRAKVAILSPLERQNPYVMSAQEMIEYILSLHQDLETAVQLIRSEYQRGYQKGFEAARTRIARVIEESTLPTREEIP